MPYDKKQITDAIIETVRSIVFDACYIRPLVYIGYGAMGVHPGDNPIEVGHRCLEVGGLFGGRCIGQWDACWVSSFTRHHVNVSMTRGKISGYYVNSIMAKREAKADGYDEAILLDPEGMLLREQGKMYLSFAGAFSRRRR